jgi:hypothetical protein
MMGRECHAIQASRTARRTVWALDAACVNCERSVAAQAASSGDKRSSSRRGRSSMNCAMDCSDSWGGHDTCSGNGGCGEDDICCECKGISKAALSRRYCLLFKVPWFNRCRSRAVVELWRWRSCWPQHPVPSHNTTRNKTTFDDLKGGQNRKVSAIRNMVSVLKSSSEAISEPQARPQFKKRVKNFLGSKSVTNIQNQVQSTQ